jgi:fructose-specific phosphotransferase system IIA component
MKLKQYVKEECFIPDLQAAGREEALRAIVEVIADKGVIKNKEEIYTKLVEREQIQSTAVGEGIAIPHCFSEEVPELVIAVARCLSGVDFDSFDGKLTKVIFVLLGNKGEHGLHLKALAHIARLIKNTEFIQKLSESSTAAEMMKAFEDEEAKL